MHISEQKFHAHEFAIRVTASRPRNTHGERSDKGGVIGLLKSAKVSSCKKQVDVDEVSQDTWGLLYGAFYQVNRIWLAGRSLHLDLSTIAKYAKFTLHSVFFPPIPVTALSLSITNFPLSHRAKLLTLSDHASTACPNYKENAISRKLKVLH